MLLTDLTPAEKRFLSRRLCAWCGQRLDRDGCGAIWKRCSIVQREERRRKCLETYKPRGARRCLTPSR